MKTMLKNLGVKIFVKEPHAYQFESMDRIDVSGYDYFFEDSHTYRFADMEGSVNIIAPNKLEGLFHKINVNL